MFPADCPVLLDAGQLGPATPATRKSHDSYILFVPSIVFQRALGDESGELKIYAKRDPEKF